MITGMGVVDTQMIDTYTLNYTAPADYAGNVGPNVTRTVTVVDELINITSLSILSSSGNNFARAGQNITLVLETDGSDITNTTGTILNRTFTKNSTGGTANFTLAIQSNDTNGNVTFSITVENSTTSMVHLTNVSITDSSFVTIDTIKPVISIINASENTVFQGNTYQDPGASITDANNASYNGTISATQLDTLVLGEQNITYTGTIDAAGNEPNPVNRTVTVLPKPLGLVLLNIEGNNSANSTSYVRLGDQITINFTANATINHIVLNITNTSTAYTINDNSTFVSYILDDSFVDADKVAFNITAYNMDNSTFSVFTHDDLNNTNLIIDNTAPTITLNDSAQF